MRFLYTILVILLLPLLAPIVWWHMRKDGTESRFKERFGFVKAQSADIWIHASSVGEIKAGIPLIKALSDKNIIVSTTTSTGFFELKKQFPDCPHFFFGFDIPWVWRLVLRKITPKKLILLEKEVWMNLIHQCRKKNIAVHLVNAKFSERSYQKSRKLKFILLPALKKIQKIYAQSKTDCQNFSRFGVAKEQCLVMGNLKFDATIPQTTPIKFPQKIVWCAGSTRENEEQILLNIHQKILEKHPDMLLIIAPRHPRRFLEVWQLIQTYSMSAGRFSESKKPHPSQQVFLLDTLGELLNFYAAADFCFVGGSLVAGIGGHNLLEPAILQKPVLSGLFLDEVQQTVKLLGDGLLQFSDEQSGFEVVSRLITDVNHRQHHAKLAFNAIKNNRGATQFCVSDIFNADENN